VEKLIAKWQTYRDQWPRSFNGEKADPRNVERENTLIGVFIEDLTSLAALSGAEVAQLKVGAQATIDSYRQRVDKQFERLAESLAENVWLEAELARLASYAQHKPTCYIYGTAPFQPGGEKQPYGQCTCGLIPVSPAQQETP